MDLDGGRALILSSSERLSAKGVAEEIAYDVLGLQRPKAEDLPTTEKLRALIAGDYTLEPSGKAVKVFEKDGKLMVQAEGQGAKKE